MKLGIAIAATVAAQGKKNKFFNGQKGQKSLKVRQFFADRRQNTENFRKFRIWEIIQNWAVYVAFWIELFGLALELELDRWLENPP